MPEIVEFYGDYEPPFDVGRIVRELLPLVPSRALSGLKSIILTASAQLPSAERRRKKRARGGRTYLGAEARGCYRSPRKGVPASIELYVDNMVKDHPEERLREEGERALIVGSTLFHEIGHHVHHCQRPRHVGAEIVAEEWEARLLHEVRRLHARS